MMISKFNRLIRNKFVWGAFAILVSVAMVGLFSPTMGGGQGGRDRTLGKLYGQPVSADAFNRARRFALGIQGRAGDTPEERAALEKQVWQRLAMLKKAERMKITVTDSELAAAIQQNPAFQENGRFSPRQYEALVRVQMRVDLPVFEAYLREEMILQRLTAAIGQSLWIAPDEVERTVRDFTDRFSIAVTALPYHSITGSVTVTEADAIAYYEAHPERFREPEARRVRYVEWPASAFEESVNIPLADIEAYYENNRRDFEMEAAATHDDAPYETAYQPLEAVSNTIHATLLHERAINAALRGAMDFADALAPGRYSDGTPFDEVAAAAGLSVATTAYFSAWSEVPGIDAGHEFNRAAFRLMPDDPAGYYSYPVRGEQAVYVMAFESEREPYVDAWSNVTERATVLARRTAEDAAFDAFTRSTRDALTAAIEAGTSVAEAAATLGLSITNPPPFSIYDSEPGQMEHFNRIVAAVIELHAGDVSEPVRTADGALLVTVLDRSPGAAMAAEMIRPEVQDMLHSYRVQAHIETWADDLLARVRSLPGDDGER